MRYYNDHFMTFLRNIKIIVKKYFTGKKNFFTLF